MIKLRFTMLIAAALLAVQPAAQAGIIEDLLAIPAIQSLLGRLPELAPLVNRCENAAFKQANLALCQQAEQAARIANAPPELRAVMATPKAAESLRGLCIEATGRPAGSSYLCTELLKLDDSVKTDRIVHEMQRTGGHDTR